MASRTFSKHTGEQSHDEPVSRVIKEVALSDPIFERIVDDLSLQMVEGMVEEVRSFPQERFHHCIVEQSGVTDMKEIVEVVRQNRSLKFSPSSACGRDREICETWIFPFRQSVGEIEGVMRIVALERKILEEIMNNISQER